MYSEIKGYWKTNWNRGNLENSSLPVVILITTIILKRKVDERGKSITTIKGKGRLMKGGNIEDTRERFYMSETQISREVSYT
jgi:hypothetical protein